MLQLARIAVRNLARNRRRTLLTLAAIALGVAATVSVRGFLNGLQHMLVASFTEGQTGAIQLHAKGYLQSVEAAPIQPNLAFDDALHEALLAVDGVAAVAPRLSFAGMVAAGDETVFAMIQGVDPARERGAMPRRLEMVVEGAWLSQGERTALLGMEIARAVGAERGERIALLTNDVDGVMNAAELAMAGSVAAAVQGEKRLVVIPLEAAQEVLRVPGRVTEIAVRVDDLEQVDAVAGRLRAALPDDVEVHTWRQIAPFAHDAVRTQDRMLGFVVTIFLFVILMGIANTLLMGVMERVREIGTMMALGARRRQILALFLFEGVVLGAAGATIGAALGTLVVEVIGAHGVPLKGPGASVPQLVVPYTKPAFLAFVVALCSVGAALAALYPAWKASRLRPVEALGKV